MAGENMRREVRFDVRMPVEIHRGKIVHALETSDVSFKGLFVKTSDPPPLRSLVRLRVSLPGRTLEAHAMVVHIVGPNDGKGETHVGAGLQFWGLSGSDRAAWDDFVRAHRPPKPPAGTSGGGPPGSGSGNPLFTETPSGVRVVAPPVPTTKVSGHW
ncbi:MAG: PilZ domain-containing protein [Deltaproteobacteria bacterium]|nr:PilZ domain-containing protein [Deltaproteobacteria bacterium]